jgi:hypothetical protein
VVRIRINVGDIGSPPVPARCWRPFGNQRLNRGAPGGQLRALLGGGGRGNRHDFGLRPARQPFARRTWPCGSRFFRERLSKLAPSVEATDISSRSLWAAVGDQ